MQEGLRILCDELCTLVVMDQITRDGFASGIPSLVFPEAYMLVVPTDAKHYEDGLFKEDHRVKKELSRVVLPPAQDRVFTDCRMMMTNLFNLKKLYRLNRLVHISLGFRRMHVNVACHTLNPRV
jgi:hypothetical protein